MKHVVAYLALGGCLVLCPMGTGFAASTGNKGQPSQTCQSFPGYPTGVTPGNAYNAPGSAFNPSGVAGGVYAGTQPQNSKNPKSVAQYDVACFQQTQMP